MSVRSSTKGDSPLRLRRDDESILSSRKSVKSTASSNVAPLSTSNLRKLDEASSVSKQSIVESVASTVKDDNATGAKAPSVVHLLPGKTDYVPTKQELKRSLFMTRMAQIHDPTFEATFASNIPHGEKKKDKIEIAVTNPLIAAKEQKTRDNRSLSGGSQSGLGHRLSSWGHKGNGNETSSDQTDTAILKLGQSGQDPKEVLLAAEKHAVWQHAERERIAEEQRIAQEEARRQAEIRRREEAEEAARKKKADAELAAQRRQEEVERKAAEQKLKAERKAIEQQHKEERKAAEAQAKHERKMAEEERKKSEAEAKRQRQLEASKPTIVATAPSTASPDDDDDDDASSVSTERDRPRYQVGDEVSPHPGVKHDGLLSEEFSRANSIHGAEGDDKSYVMLDDEGEVDRTTTFGGEEEGDHKSVQVGSDLPGALPVRDQQTTTIDEPSNTAASGTATPALAREAVVRTDSHILDPAVVDAETAHLDTHEPETFSVHDSAVQTEDDPSGFKTVSRPESAIDVKTAPTENDTTPVVSSAISSVPATTSQNRSVRVAEDRTPKSQKEKDGFLNKLFRRRSSKSKGERPTRKYDIGEPKQQSEPKSAAAISATPIAASSVLAEPHKEDSAGASVEATEDTPISHETEPEKSVATSTNVEDRDVIEAKDGKLPAYLIKNLQTPQEGPTETGSVPLTSGAIPTGDSISKHSETPDLTVTGTGNEDVSEQEVAELQRHKEDVDAASVVHPTTAAETVHEPSALDSAKKDASAPSVDIPDPSSTQEEPLASATAVSSDKSREGKLDFPSEADLSTTSTDTTKAEDRA